MGAITRVFDLFYKRFQTGSTGTNNNDGWIGNLSELWWDIDSTTPLISSSFLNYPKDPSISSSYLTTRDSGSNQFYRAIPWGSAACDYLWNCNVPSWSYHDSSSTVEKPGGGGSRAIVDRFWTINTLTTGSFFRYYPPGVNNSFGVAGYPVTSSWRVLDLKFFASMSGNTTSSFRYLHQAQGETVYPTFVGSQYIAFVSQSERSQEIAYDITWPAITSLSTASVDGGYFDLGGAVGITRSAISRSLVTMSVYNSDVTATGIRNMTEALKSRRLFFPVPVSGSGTTLGTDYWFKQNTGYNATEVFDTNGGIYNVQFSLKKASGSYDMYPDNDMFMTVFIHDVQSNVPVLSERVPGAAGWYPPENNIVVIGNGYGLTPQMTFVDQQSGLQIERFNFNVIQYGYPAQFCIEVSGSLSSDKYFGVLVDDFQICKVGVTTDPQFIKQQSVAQTTVIFTGQGTVAPPSFPAEES